MTKGRKFIVIILMTVVTVLFIVGCIIKPTLMGLMPLVMMLDGIYGGYLGVNVWQKKKSKNEISNNIHS